MLHLGGAELYELFEHLPNTGGETDFEAAVAALNRHFDPQLNPDYERFKLRQARVHRCILCLPLQAGKHVHQRQSE